MIFSDEHCKAKKCNKMNNLTDSLHSRIRRTFALSDTSLRVKNTSCFVSSLGGCKERVKKLFNSALTSDATYSSVVAHIEKWCAGFRTPLNNRRPCRANTPAAFLMVGRSGASLDAPFFPVSGSSNPARPTAKFRTLAIGVITRLTGVWA